MRKPYKTPDGGEIRLKPWINKGFHEDGSSVLSGNKTRKRVYLETI
jgi:hypothetical protein